MVLTAGCQTKPEVVDLAAKARALHARVLTLDTHCDTAFNLLRKDWKIGDRHDPALRTSGKIDLPADGRGRIGRRVLRRIRGPGPPDARGERQGPGRDPPIIDALHADDAGNTRSSSASP